jgi:hypothetical protein
MAEVLSNSGIVTGQPVLAAQVSQSVQAFTGAVGYDITISGSLNLPANTQMNGTASNALFATSAGSTTGPVAQVTVSEETAAETNYIVFSPSSSVGGSAQNLKNTDTVGAGGATGGLEYNANTGNLKGKSFESSVSAATTVGFVGTSSFSNLALASQASTLTNEASDTSCFIPFYTSNTGNFPTKTNNGLLFNSATALLTVTSASVGDLISTGRVDMVSASFDDLVVSGAGRVGANFTVGGISTVVGAAIMSNTLTVSDQIDSNKVGTLTSAALKFQTVASPDTYTAIHFDGTTDDSRIEYGHDAADEFFTRIRMSDNLNTDHFDVLFTGSGAGANSTPFSAYGDKILLAQPSATADAKVGIGISSSGSLQSMLTVEGSSSAAGRVVRVMDKGQNHIVMSVDYDANTDGIVRVLSGSNGQDGIQLASNDVSFFSKNVGLGDFTPEARLSVRSSASAASRIFEVQNNTGNLLAMIESNATNTGGIFKLNNSAGNQKVKFNSEDNVDMFIGVGTGTPNLGIGTASPSADIHLKKTGSVTFKLESDETDGTSYMRFLNDAISWRLGVQSNDKFALYDSTNAVTHLVAENNSLRPCIGIGTTNPSEAVVLDVVGPMRVSGSTINRFRTLTTTQYNYSADLSGGQLIRNGTGSADFVNISQSLILLNDATNGSVDNATLDITEWVDNSQLGQQLEVVIVGDGTDEITQNGIQLQYYNAGNTIQINGGHTQNGAGSGTFGATYNYSSSVYNAPTKYVGASLKLMKTTSDNIKAWGTAMSGSIA